MLQIHDKVFEPSISREEINVIVETMAHQLAFLKIRKTSVYNHSQGIVYVCL